MKHSQEKLEHIFRDLSTDPELGLTDQQALEIQALTGKNKFEDEKQETILQKVLHHLTDVTSIILLVAAAISLYLAFSADHGFTDPIIIMAIVVIDTILAVRQEMGAEKALDALKKMHAHTTVVIRNGTKQSIQAEELVVGDILLLEAGDMIPADARIIECANLKAEESVLTGESEPVEKDCDAQVADKAPLGDQANMLFSECLITNGRAKAVVVATGMFTEMGKIAGLLNNTLKLKTPLQKRLASLGKVLSVVAVAAALVLFVLELLNGSPMMTILMSAVALAVAVVPEILPVTVTVTLALGVQQMARKHAIIRKIPAVETLGSTSVICSDKTGTLTMNRMSIKRLWVVGNDPLAAADQLSQDELNLLKMLGLASNASIETVEGEEKIIGDPTEAAIVRLLQDKLIDKKSLDASFPKVFEVPFDSQRKLMTTVHALQDSGFVSITKGAFDRIPVDTKNHCQVEAKQIHDQFAGSALRVIALGFKHYQALPERLDADELEHGLTFAGLVGMIDPPRPESQQSVQAAKEAGIKTVMITGDHLVTASAIAKEIGILGEGERAISGAELAEMSDVALAEDVMDYSVYARVSPEDKIRIVKALQSRGETVAMTGDGVNDAPALKAADVGVAMGSGSDVSKNASDMILTDDNFASIVSAIAVGRRVYDNIRKVLFSLLSCNMSEIFIMLVAVLMGWGVPLMALQLLFINVVADGIPVLFICREPAEADIMKRRPINRKAGLFSDGLAARIISMTTVFTVISLLGFYIGKFVDIPGALPPSVEIGQTMAFIIIGWSSIINIMNIKSRTQSIFRTGFKGNLALAFGICLSIGILTLIAGTPYVMGVFHCVPMDMPHWLIAIGFSLVPLLVGEIYKLILRRIRA